MIIRKSEREIERMAAAGALVAETIAHVGSLLAPGVTTDELDAAADTFIRERGGVPTSQGYKGYPKAICISPNDVVVHGIPGPYEVQAGDVITIDVGVTLDAYIADSAYTFGVGELDPEAQRLLDTAQDALAAGIAEARAGNRVGDIAHAVQTVVEEAGFSVVRSLVGHGVGRYYHEDPHIPNFGEPGRGPRLSEGMTIAIEPMITAGGSDIHVGSDGWTITTADGSLSAHFEHTVAITAHAARGCAGTGPGQVTVTRFRALRRREAAAKRTPSGIFARPESARAGSRAATQAAAKRTPSGIFARPESARADSGLAPEGLCYDDRPRRRAASSRRRLLKRCWCQA
jgi:methionyl aminopeptidase